ncbi:MAG: O-antigen ligase family protein [Flavobacteriales bacterium]
MAGVLPFLTDKHLNILFLIGAGLIVVGMPYSLVLMSIGTIWVSSVYILQGNYRDKLKKAGSPVVLCLLGFLTYYFVALIWTQDLTQGWKEGLKILPLVVIPLVFSGITGVSHRQKKGLMWLFVAATLSSVLVCYGVALARGTLTTGDPREISFLTSHIRLSLFVCLSVLWVVISQLNPWLKLLLSLILLSFIVVVQSITGISVLLFLSIAVLLGIIPVKGISTIRMLRSITATVLILSFVFLGFTTIDYYSVKTKVPTPKFTKFGNKYNTEFENNFVENGSYLWSYICKDELEQAWKERTDRSVWVQEGGEFADYAVITRYLNNSNLTKDREGVNALSDEDIERIISGNPYPNHWKYKGFSKRLRGFFFQIEKSQLNADYTGNSITEKLMYQQAGWHVFSSHWLIGAGTGDLKSELNTYYRDQYPSMNENYRRKPHNQFLTVGAMFGVIGLILFLLFFWSLWRSPSDMSVTILRSFILIVLLSFLSEDTASSQAGITFIGFFSGLLVSLRPA